MLSCPAAPAPKSAVQPAASAVSTVAPDPDSPHQGFIHRASQAVSEASSDAGCPSAFEVIVLAVYRFD